VVRPTKRDGIVAMDNIVDLVVIVPQTCRMVEKDV
jgi:hypothetical protein